VNYTDRKIAVSIGESGASKTKSSVMSKQKTRHCYQLKICSVSLNSHVRLLTGMNLPYCHPATFLGVLHEDQRDLCWLSADATFSTRSSMFYSFSNCQWNAAQSLCFAISLSVRLVFNYFSLTENEKK
jgi:hypothetical protein